MTSLSKMNLNLNQRYQKLIIFSIALFVINKELYCAYATYTPKWNAFYFANENILKLIIPLIAYNVIINTCYKKIALSLFLIQLSEFITGVWELMGLHYNSSVHMYVNMVSLLLILLKLLYDVKRASKN